MSSATVAIVGTGTIGTGWAALFALNGWRTILYDPAAGQARSAARSVDEILAAAHGPADEGPARGACSLAERLEDAIAAADLVQESAPDSLPLKRELLSRVSNSLPRNVPIASSTSMFRPSELASGVPHGERILVGHPFHPVHIIPLVEVAGAPQTDPRILERATQIYASLGKIVIRVRRECTGHIVNRLQAALFREAAYLLAEGIATVQDIDRGIAYGPALRWPLTGVFTTWHLAGGPGGIHDYMEKLAPSIEQIWRGLGDAELSPRLRRVIEDQVVLGSSGRAPREMEQARDQLLVQLTRWLDAHQRLV